MPHKALRPARSDRDRDRDVPVGFFRRIAVSEDGGRPTATDGDDHPQATPTPTTRRFSLMRFRHASDSQLSLKAKEHAARAHAAPPLPVAPTIITTAPTVVDAEHDAAQPVPKKRARLQHFSLRRRSFDPSARDRPGILRKSADRTRPPLGLAKSQASLHEEAPARASVESTTATLGLPVPRASDSSRSDGSSGGHVSFEHTPRPQHPPRTGSARFNFGRRKQRASLFPLPMKIDPPQFPDTAPATPRVSTGRRSSGSPHHSPPGSPPLTARRIHHGGHGAQTPPPSSASQVALAPNSLNMASSRPGSLFRNGSTKSTHSVRSSPNRAGPLRLGARGRSSTMGSLGGRSDDAVPPTTPPNGASGRTSTSTAGRSSFSNLFGLSSRFRPNSEPHSPRHGSPAHAFMGTSGLSSHQTSLSISRETLVLPTRAEGEPPGHYLERIEANNVDKSVIASYLSKTDDPFLLSVLRSYMRKFAFFGDPLDMAVRKLLMQVELPKETQQIDRVLQGFADRYHECNPGIYINTDKAYFISFSIIILHTDVFNKNNKRKMTRLDYIKNSSCEGVSEDVLGCFYDNVVYTPFIHIEDEVDLKTISSKKSKRTAALKGPINDPARKASKEPIDPYTLIFEGKLDVLRPTIKDVMNIDDPYNYLGTAATLDTKNVYKSFTRYGVIQIVSSRSRPEAFMSEAAQENPLGTTVGIVEMPVTKVGVLWRKGTKRKKARSPWQEWGAVLTRSGLSFFKNSSWTKNLMNQHEQHLKRGDTGPALFQPPLEDFKQDHIIPMDGAVSLVDNTYKKHKNAFVIYSKAGEETFLADSEKDLNEWLGVLNYTAAFETMGVRSRGMIGGLYEGQKNRGTQRLESATSIKSIPTRSGEVTTQSGRVDNTFAQQMMNARRENMQMRISDSEEKLAQAIKELEARLRDARHLQILAPIQPKTREQVIHAAGRLSAKLKWARIEIWRMKCHRDILAHELEDEKQGAAERQARVDRVAEFGPVPQQQLSPRLSHRASKISGLARLASKTSSLTSGQKPPLSPGASSARPGTKSSKDTDFGGEDTYRTPPETSRQSSPSDPSGQFHIPPLSFNSTSSDRRSSMASSSALTQSPRLLPSEHRPSIVTTDDGTGTVDSDSDDDVRYTTPPPIEPGTAEPKTPEIPSLDGMRSDVALDSDTDQPLGSIAGSPATQGKRRRSLHRTLRETSHRRSHKGRDSSSTIVSEDAQDNEGLTRDKVSFTVHGKKASVIHFGGDWHNTTAEERLKRKKELQDATENHAADDQDGQRGLSGSTATVVSPGPDNGEDLAFRKLSVGAIKQRHTSAQTITPANFKDPLGHQEESNSEDSEMSDIAEESQDRNAGDKRKLSPVKIDVLVDPSPPTVGLTSPITTNLVQM
ncbi:hypothetical protein BDU57DRAFT_444578 [Ampelomyces quisqualis]|uniref:Protein transport protein sec73 n=1 Tax=Ampelomyces quisqualis TaxID=50730 RepID=A0A6A5QNN4_AMPQU|nr:hypothetical protein BDU57DRAFT_444578 [Ampelomyces quisqualis]